IHSGAGLFEPVPEFSELLLPTLGARRDEHLHIHAAIDRGGQFTEYRLVVATKERQRDTGTGFPDGVEHGITPRSRRREDAIGQPAAEGFGHLRFGLSHDTAATPAVPPLMSCALRSSSATCGDSHVWYLMVTSSDWVISRGSNAI